MLPNLSSLRLGPTKRVYPAPPNGRPLGLPFGGEEESDEEESDEEESDEEESDDAEYKGLPDPKGYAQAVQRYEDMQATGPRDTHASQAYKYLKSIRNGMYKSEGQSYLDDLYDDLSNFQKHYSNASGAFKDELGGMLSLLATDAPLIKKEGKDLFPELFPES